MIALAVTAGVASAHVSTEPSEVSRGDTSRISFRVPNESPTFGTVKLELTFPTEHPISSLRVEESPVGPSRSPRSSWTGPSR
ncbi:DUF1775 domain-containing protein [Saccharopolyspora soli]|uniref:DUF1775 domain-containing protein n=1 Tax=Saccharopolyspora soli TaxID=2926618 RepID=UPI003555E408